MGEINGDGKRGEGGGQKRNKRWVGEWQGGG